MDDTCRQVAKLLEQASTSERGANDLLPLVYEELRREAAVQLAREPSGQTLQPTALVHEAFIRLVGDPDLRWESRLHFFLTAARAMRRILIDRARRVAGPKRGGHGRRTVLDPDEIGDAEADRGLDIEALDAALERLEARDRRKAQVVHLRYFAGLSIEQAAAALNLSLTTVKDEWMYARAWLRRDLRRAGEEE